MNINYDAAPIPHDEFDWFKEANKTDFTNKVIVVLTSPEKGVPMKRQFFVEAVSGKGLEGDRNNLDILLGAFSKSKKIPLEDRMISVISLQDIALANCELIQQNKIPYKLEETRRQIVIDMPSERERPLLGKKIKIGSVEIDITNPCDPCARPSALLKRANDFEPAFQNRGGVRGRVLGSGSINLSCELVILGEADSPTLS